NGQNTRQHLLRADEDEQNRLDAEQYAVRRVEANVEAADPRARVDRLDEQVLPRLTALRFFAEQLDALQRPDRFHQVRIDAGARDDVFVRAPLQWLEQRDAQHTGQHKRAARDGGQQWGIDQQEPER